MEDGCPGRLQGICGLWGYLTHLTMADPLRQRCSGPASTVTASWTGPSSPRAVPRRKEEEGHGRDRREGKGGPAPSPSRRAARGPAQAAVPGGAQGPPARRSRSPEAAPSRTRGRPSTCRVSPPAGENRHLTAQPAHPPPSLRCSGTRTAPMLTDTDTHPAPPPRLLPAPAPAAYTLGWTRLCSDVLAYVRMYSAVFGWAGVVSAGLPSA